MEHQQSFEEQFNSFANFIGNDISMLTSNIGHCDNYEEKESIDFMYYNEFRATFSVNKNNQIISFRIPSIVTDEEIEAIHQSKYYSFEGIHLGMTMADVIKIKGKPTESGNTRFLIWYKWLYSPKKNANSKSYIPFITFTTDGGDITWVENGTEFKDPVSEVEWIVSEFGVEFEDDITFEQQFLNNCKLIGSKEYALIDKIGKPDEVSYEEDGKKFLYYKRFSAIFTIPSDYQIVECLICPHPDFKRKGAYYSLLDLTVGDTRSDIINVLGKPTGETSQIWAYANKTGTTISGDVYELRILFDEDNPNLIGGFSGMLINPEIAESHSIKPKSGCFVATACYGDYDAPEVLVLRKFRDEVLLKNKIGMILVHIYYFLSPSFAKMLKKSKKSKGFVRKYILSPIISKIKIITDK